jgi:hypothetical protein
LKDAFKRLLAIIYLGFSSGDLAISETEVKQAANDFELAFWQSLAVRSPNKINETLRLISTKLALVIYDLDKGSGCPAAQKKLVRTHLCVLFNKLQHAAPPLSPYDDLTANHLLPHKLLAKKLQEVHRRLDNNNDVNDLLTILQPHINTAQKTADLSFPHWHWWCCFYANAIRLWESGEVDFLQNLLIALNFNTPAFCKMLAEEFKLALASVSTAEEQAAFISNQMIRYKLMPPPQLAFLPGAVSVRRFMRSVCKTEWSWRIAAENKKAGYQPQQQNPQLFTLKTCLSVKQTALLVRLLTKTGMINSDNHTVLLKSLAAILSTSHKDEVSAESLHVNFYRLQNPAKEIVKEYLFKMLNELKSL